MIVIPTYNMPPGTSWRIDLSSPVCVMSSKAEFSLLCDSGQECGAFVEFDVVVGEEHNM